MFVLWLKLESKSFFQISYGSSSALFKYLSVLNLFVWLLFFSF
jgi:hypothetical protein